MRNRCPKHLNLFRSKVFSVDWILPPNILRIISSLVIRFSCAILSQCEENIQTPKVFVHLFFSVTRFLGRMRQPTLLLQCNFDLWQAIRYAPIPAGGKVARKNLVVSSTRSNVFGLFLTGSRTAVGGKYIRQLPWGNPLICTPDENLIPFVWTTSAHFRIYFRSHCRTQVDATLRWES